MTNINCQELESLRRTIYPNLHTLLQICVTVPVTSCKCERSESMLKILKTYLRAFIGQQWLCDLTFLYINYAKDIDIDGIIDIFTGKRQKALEFESIRKYKQG